LPTLAKLRYRKFLTQTDLANLVGTHPRQISDWERGRYRPNMTHLRRLCEVLEVAPEDIEWPAKDPARPSLAGSTPAAVVS
jgi:DNA-binding XRE family transcriptional regulator